MPRIYLVETKSGGKVRCSFESGYIVTLKKGIGHYKSLIDAHAIDGSFMAVMAIEELWLEGYDSHKYAIEILDVREEDAVVAQDYTDESLCMFNSNCCKDNCCICSMYKNPLLKWNNTKAFPVIGTPSLFQYITDPYTGEKSILMSCKKKWIDMILEGDKTLVFVNRLPKLLKEIDNNNEPQ